MKKGEKEEKGGRKREKERLGRRPVTRYRKRRWDNACHVPSTFAQKATMFEPLRKNSKNAEQNKKNANLSRANTGSSPQTDQNGSTGPEGHRCSLLSSKNEQKCNKTPSPLSSTQRKCHEPQQKRQFHIPNQQTSHKKHGKTKK